MKNNGKKGEPLRYKAEKILRNKNPEIKNNTEAELIRLIHELEVHQIELELQNEELNSAKLESELAAEKYTEIYDFAPSAYFILSKDGRIEGSNLSASLMLGKERSFLKNYRLDSFISESTKSEFNVFFQKVCEKNGRASCEVGLKLTGEMPFYVLVSGTSIKNGAQFLINMIDITERRKAIESSIETQRLNAIGEMTSAIAHDFNNSLQAIIGNIEVLIHTEKLQEKVIHHLNTIKSVVTDAAVRIHLMQRFVGKKQNRSPYFLIDLNTIISEVIEQTRLIWKDEPEKKGVTINLEFKPGEISEVFGNQGELRTVLYNLIKNSIEAMPAGGSISIGTEKTFAGIALSISDTGIGMTPETRVRVFQPFYSTKESSIGKGLGMSGALSIIKEHGGEIYVKKTAPGKGTTVEVILPYSKSGNTHEPENIKETDISLERPLRILWVDDDRSINAMAGEIIKILGHSADIVDNGEEALNYLSRNSYDLIITDIGMPGMNGWQVADIIKERYNGKMKVAVISGWGDEIDKAEKEFHGVSYDVSKPFNIDQLQGMLNNVSKAIKRDAMVS